ncbi:protein SPMIP1 [Ambystoma mexicanum]|uniref:protein SPMIP1 n=1 Tax=Ambystoma mexicanum TaxID=8296 RepID=UPI0037E81C8E
MAMTTQMQNAWREVYVKEMKVRLKWHLQNIESAKAAAAAGPKKARVRERVKLPNIHPITEEPKAEEKTTTELPAEAKGEEETLGADMKPATPRTKALLYHGISKLEEGRYLYLRARNKIKPEDKYIYPITSNFEYGWQMGHLSTRLGKTHIFRRCRIVNDTFFRKNGAMALLDPRDMAL